ncbi:uncharacterized protein LOC126367817 isoform X2 [Pectinophora gossypiella]|uniref:uncharacterized protein LOC126367817 isoform X2 n=1 Tax=Pectinophora gossypiella TaxID=13191 RepID=UPI00214E5D66|nr:uncharacterized protein LOC126367817 isoform X2 [Pectinophora gossypiella]
MEADSTTRDNVPKHAYDQGLHLPFPSSPGNLIIYKDLITNNSDKTLESHVVQKLQDFGVLPRHVKCPSAKPDCHIVSKSARVIDRVQWVCEGCGKRLPIRTGSFFLRLQCSILQALQIILAWCDDVEPEFAAQHFGVKPRVASMICDRLDELAVKEQGKSKLGGDGSVVVTELYPDCLTRLSPDTTDRPHVHRILMLADTKHVPTQYQLHVIRDDLKKSSANIDDQMLAKEVEEALQRMTEPDSMLVTGNNVPPVEGASTLQQLTQYCDVDMQHFLSSRIWRQALTLCVESRDLCSGCDRSVCAGAVQRYLMTSLFRFRHADDLFRSVLGYLAAEYTDH